MDTRTPPAALRPRPALPFSFAALAILLCSCEAPQPVEPTAVPTQSDRLMAAYPELEGGGFAKIADFEDPLHMELVQLISATPAARFSVEEGAGRTGTGGRGLVFSSGSPNDVLVLGNELAQRWYLKRDWRPFDLLLLSVHSPAPGLRLELQVVSGQGANRREAASTRPLDAGWNTLRLDVAELGERVAIDDIQQIRFRLESGSAGPAALVIDDVLLATDREVLLGSPPATDGELFVRRAGRRWHVGAGGQFELVFASGQIVGWFDLQRDPARLTNLVAGTALGPTPVRLGPGDQALPLWDRGPDQFVETSQRLTEANAVRVVLDTQWQPAGSDGSRAGVAVRCRHTIYRSGAVFATVELAGAGRDTRYGLEVETASEPCGPVATAGQLIDRPDSRELPTFGGISCAEGSSGLWYAVYRGGAEVAPGSMLGRLDANQGTLSLLSTVQPQRGETLVWYSAVQLGRGVSPGSPESILAWAHAFQSPPSIPFRIGSSQAMDPGRGAYVLRAEGGRLRFSLARSGSFPFRAFEVPVEGQQEAWVYVDHMVHRPVARGADGRLLFEVGPGAGEVVEVLLRTP